MYRKTYACSHEEYLDEPADIVSWLIEIGGLDDAIKEERENRRQAANQPQGNWGPRG